jgi:4-alpha-glucanotransferase
MSLFDVVRIDHFRGFVAYWAVPAGDRTAAGGRWKRGPGGAVFDAARRELGDLPLVAEDLGVITPAVHRLRDELGFPGMLVLQFGFEPDEPHSPHRPANHVENRVVYTGTHDHDTARGWFESLNRARQEAVRSEFGAYGIRERQPWWGLIRLAMASPARVAMIQMQDVLGLGSEARMNKPGSASGSWRWRMEAGAFNRAMARRLREITSEAGRLPAA